MSQRRQPIHAGLGVCVELVTGVDGALSDSLVIAVCTHSLTRTQQDALLGCRVQRVLSRVRHARPVTVTAAGDHSSAWGCDQLKTRIPDTRSPHKPRCVRRLHRRAELAPTVTRFGRFHAEFACQTQGAPGWSEHAASTQPASVTRCAAAAAPCPSQHLGHPPVSQHITQPWPSGKQAAPSISTVTDSLSRPWPIRTSCDPCKRWTAHASQHRDRLSVDTLHLPLDALQLVAVHDVVGTACRSRSHALSWEPPVGAALATHRQPRKPQCVRHRRCMYMVLHTWSGVGLHRCRFSISAAAAAAALPAPRFRCISKRLGGAHTQSATSNAQPSPHRAELPAATPWAVKHPGLAGPRRTLSDRVPELWASYMYIHPCSSRPSVCVCVC